MRLVGTARGLSRHKKRLVGFARWFPSRKTSAMRLAGFAHGYVWFSAVRLVGCCAPGGDLRITSMQNGVMRLVGLAHSVAAEVPAILQQRQAAWGEEVPLAEHAGRE